MPGNRKDWLEDLLTGKGWHEQMGGSGGGGSNGRSPFSGSKPPIGKLAGLGVAALLLVWGALSSFYTVQPEERAVVKRFGRVVGITDPGLGGHPHLAAAHRRDARGASPAPARS